MQHYNYGVLPDCFGNLFGCLPYKYKHAKQGVFIVGLGFRGLNPKPYSWHIIGHYDMRLFTQKVEEGTNQCERERVLVHPGFLLS
jgi:hypothetical protein